ncbi:MAG: MCE family protein [Sporichthyaceae bacterium]
MNGENVRGALVRLLAFATAAILIASLLYTTLRDSISGQTNSYTAMFTDASGLNSGDPVRVAGVRVGRVDSVKLDGTLARVRFSVLAEQLVLANTRIAIRYQNLIGQRYVALLPGKKAAPPLTPGATIELASTANALDLTVVTNGFQPLFSELAPEEINRLSVSLVQVLQGEGGSITALLRTTSELSGRLADRDEVIGRVIDNLAAVATEIGSREVEVDAVIGELRRLSTAAAGDRVQIGESIAALSGLTDATTGLLREIRPQLRTDIAKLERVARAYARAQGPFEGAVQGLPLALAAFARQMQYGSWINLYLCNLVFVGPEGQRERVGGGTANSQVCT